MNLPQHWFLFYFSELFTEFPCILISVQLLQQDVQVSSWSGSHQPPCFLVTTPLLMCWTQTRDVPCAPLLVSPTKGLPKKKWGFGKLDSHWLKHFNLSRTNRYLSLWRLFPTISWLKVISLACHSWAQLILFTISISEIELKCWFMKFILKSLSFNLLSFNSSEVFFQTVTIFH